MESEPIKKESKTHPTGSELSWMPPSDRTGGYCGWAGQCSEAAAAAGTVVVRPAVPCARLTRLVCSYLCLMVLSCSFQVLCKNSVSDITWREIEFFPIFLTVPNAIIFKSRAFSKKNASGGLSLAHSAEHGHMCLS